MKLVATYPNISRHNVIANISGNIAIMAIQYMPMELDDLANMFADTLLVGHELYEMEAEETLHLIIKSDSLALFNLKENAEHCIARCEKQGETPTYCFISCMADGNTYTMHVFE